MVWEEPGLLELNINLETDVFQGMKFSSMNHRDQEAENTIVGDILKKPVFFSFFVRKLPLTLVRLMRFVS